jgi:hypothetical protein
MIIRDFISNDNSALDASFGLKCARVRKSQQVPLVQYLGPSIRQ